MRSEAQTILFAAVVCVVCSLLLSVTAVSLKGRQDANKAHDMRLNILMALGVPVVDAQGDSLSKEAVAQIFSESITSKVVDADGNETTDTVESLTTKELTNKDKNKLPLYVYRKDGTTRYCFPVTGRGLWGTLFGYLAMEQDLATIAGLTFYDHIETPGLGAEISEPWFGAQFTDAKKVLHRDGKPVEFVLEKGRGTVANKYPDGHEHAVDGPSGATMTARGVQALLNDDFALYNKYFINAKLRAGAPANSGS